MRDTFLFRPPLMLLSVMVAAWLSLGMPEVIADATSPTTALNAPPEVSPTPDVSIGIAGNFRVGAWTAIRINPNGTMIHSVQTEDGDGASVDYVQADAKTQKGEKASLWAYAIPGSTEAPLLIETVDGNRIATRFPSDATTSNRFRPSSADTVASDVNPMREVPLNMPWIVSIGDALGVDEIGANRLLRRSSSVAVSKVISADQLPDRSIGYDGVDLVMISSSGIDVLRGMDVVQQTALRDWIISGGRVFLMLGESLAEVQSHAPWLVELIPSAAGSASEPLLTVQMDPSAIETFTSTQTLLQPFAGAKLPRGIGDVIVLGRTVRRVSTPVAAEYVVGFGKLTVLAADLDRAPFVGWPQRLDFIMQLTKDLVVPEDASRSSLQRGTAFDDLAGQMRATLDRFPSQRRFNFSIVSLILLSLIALVGPLDYFFVNRILGKPLLGWITFPVVAIGMSAFLIFQAQPIPGVATRGSIPVNRIEFVDIDSKEQCGESFAWGVLYSHDARQLNFASVAGPSLDQLSTNVSSILTSPYGFPGRSFGSIQVTGEDARLPTYEVKLSEVSLENSGTSEQQFSSNMIAMPLAPRSSKSVASRTSFQPNVSDELVMYRRRGSELLQGELVNPLSVDLLNGMLIYRNWVYLLPTRFPAGGRIESLESLRQKNFRWQLSRQRSLESSTETQLWDATLFDNPERVAEMIMFHNMVGGQRYTTLRDDVLSSLDFSHLLTGERCILIGKLAEPFTQLEALAPNSETESQTETEFEGQTLTLLRLVIPVENKTISY